VNKRLHHDLGAVKATQSRAALSNPAEATLEAAGGWIGIFDFIDL